MPRPSGFRAQIEVNGDVLAAERLEGIGRRARKTRPLMETIVGVLFTQQRARIASKPWKPLADSTVERKISENENPDIFRDEARRIKGQPTRTPDAMYQALTTPNAPGQLRYITNASAAFGLDSKGRGPFFYARFVQNVKGNQRRILAISADDALQLTQLVASYIYDGWEKPGGLTARKPTSTSGMGFMPTGGGLPE